MSVKIRLQRQGRKKRPFYHIVVADSRAPRDGRFIERIGIYNPMTKPATIELDRDKAFDWLMDGAQPTDTVRAILRFKGVLYRKHLMRGVQKGALTEEEALKKYEEWIAAKEEKVAERVRQTEEEKAAYHARIFGTRKAVEEPEAESEATTEEGVTEDTTTDEAPDAENQATGENTSEEAEEEATAEEEKTTEEEPVEEEKAEEEKPAEEVKE